MTTNYVWYNKKSKGKWEGFTITTEQVTTSLQNQWSDNNYKTVPNKGNKKSG